MGVVNTVKKEEIQQVCYKGKLTFWKSKGVKTYFWSFSSPVLIEILSKQAPENSDNKHTRLPDVATFCYCLYCRRKNPTYTMK